MGVADFPRWVWVIAGLLLGLAHGAVRDWAGAVDPLEDYAVLLTDPREFEHALLAEQHGHRRFKDVVVYPHWTRGPKTGGKTLVHLVTGAYWDGRTETKNGATVARWDPACYVAPVPYEPVLNLPGAGEPTTATVEATKARTVLDYLGGLRAARGVEFRYAWWWWMRRPLFTSTLVGVVLIGGVAPTVLSLLAYGTWFPPPRGKRASLRRVRNPKKRRGVSVVSVGLPRSGGHETLPEAQPGTVVSVPAVAALPPLAPADAIPVSTAPADEKHFGARQEDFYPTELHDAHEHK